MQMLLVGGGGGVYAFTRDLCWGGKQFPICRRLSIFQRDLCWFVENSLQYADCQFFQPPKWPFEIHQTLKYIITHAHSLTLTTNRHVERLLAGLKV